MSWLENAENKCRRITSRKTKRLVVSRRRIINIRRFIDDIIRAMLDTIMPPIVKTIFQLF